MMLNGKRLSVLMAATALSALVAAPAQAQSVEELKAQLAALAKRIDELEKKQEDDKKKKSPVVKKAEPAFGLATDDGLFEFNIRGRLLADAAWVSDDDNIEDTKATEFRAARLGVEGKAWGSVGYKFEADFAGNEVDLKDAYLSYKSGFGTWYFGQMNTPNSLEELSSSRHTTFMERAAFTDAFNFQRMLGVAWGDHGENWTVKLGAYRGTAGTAGEDEGYLLGARGTYGGKLEDGAWQVGGWLRYQDVGDGDAIRYRQRPHQHLARNRYVATPRVATEEFMVGLEAALQMGAFHAASEWSRATAENGGTGGRDANFWGGYVEAGWFITGEHKALNLAKGVWDRPKVDNPVQDGGWGAWQIAGRFDRIDLSDEDVFGGEQNTYLLGLNWYMNRHTRFMVNYSYATIDNAFDVSLNGTDGENAVNALGFRAQVDW